MRLTIDITRQDGQFVPVISTEREGMERRERPLLSSADSAEALRYAIEWVKQENARGEWSRLFGSRQ